MLHAMEEIKRGRGGGPHDTRYRYDCMTVLALLSRCCSVPVCLGAIHTLRAFHKLQNVDRSGLFWSRYLSYSLDWSGNGLDGMPCTPLLLDKNFSPVDKISICSTMCLCISLDLDGCRAPRMKRCHGPCNLRSLITCLCFRQVMGIIGFTPFGCFIQIWFGGEEQACQVGQPWIGRLVVSEVGGWYFGHNENVAHGIDGRMWRKRLYFPGEGGQEDPGHGVAARRCPPHHHCGLFRGGWHDHGEHCPPELCQGDRLCMASSSWASELREREGERERGTTPDVLSSC